MNAGTETGSGSESVAVGLGVGRMCDACASFGLARLGKRLNG